MKFQLRNTLDRIRRAFLAWPPVLYFDYWYRAHRNMTHPTRGERELKILKYLVNPSKHSVDVGANKGIYTYWLERYSKHTYVYEPNADLVRTFLAAAGSKTTVRASAISDQTGTARFRVAKSRISEGNGTQGDSWFYLHQGGTLEVGNISGLYDEVEVPVRRLDDEGLHNIGFIKIDVEGHELEAVRGAARLIRDEAPVLMVEIEECHSHRPALEDVKQIESEIGYTAYALLPEGLTLASKLDPKYTSLAWRGKGGTYVRNFIFFPTSKPFPEQIARLII